MFNANATSSAARDVGISPGSFEPAQRVKPLPLHPPRHPLPGHRLLNQIHRSSISVQHRRALLHPHQIGNQLSIRTTIEHNSDYATSRRQFSPKLLARASGLRTKSGGLAVASNGCPQHGVPVALAAMSSSAVET